MLYILNEVEKRLFDFTLINIRRQTLLTAVFKNKSVLKLNVKTYQQVTQPRGYGQSLSYYELEKLELTQVSNKLSCNRVRLRLARSAADDNTANWMITNHM